MPSEIKKLDEWDYQQRGSDRDYELATKINELVEAHNDLERRYGKHGHYILKEDNDSGSSYTLAVGRPIEPPTDKEEAK